MRKILTFCILIVLSTITTVRASSVSPFIDYLEWYPSEETSSIWSSIVTDSSTTRTRFSPKDINFDWSHGFRAGLAYQANPNALKMQLYWTHLPSKSTITYQPNLQIVVPDFFSGFFSENVFFGADIDWRLVANSVDFSVSDTYSVGQGVTLSPSIGIKGATINQTIYTDWDAVFYTSTEKIVHDFSGIGPSLGLDATWKMSPTIALDSRLLTAFMWGTWKVHDTYIRPDVPAVLVTATTITTNMNHAELGTAMLDYFLGLKWTPKDLITLSLGYEIQYWPNQLRLTTFQQLPTHGDLTYQGATCGISLNF